MKKIRYSFLATVFTLLGSVILAQYITLIPNKVIFFNESTQFGINQGAIEIPNTNIISTGLWVLPIALFLLSLFFLIKHIRSNRIKC